MVEEERMSSGGGGDEVGNQLRKMSVVVAGGGAGAEESGLGFDKFGFGFGFETLDSLPPLLFGSLGCSAGRSHSSGGGCCDKI